MFQKYKRQYEKYADDTGQVSAGDSMEEPLSHLQNDCVEISEWIGKWRLKVSEPKTEFSVFQKSVKKSENLQNI